MDKSFKFRYVNELTGTFVIAVIALLIVGVLLAGRAQQWFDPVYEVRTILPPEGSFGLQKGADVIVLGTSVGTVGGIEPIENDRLQAVLKIRGNFVNFIKTDSVAVIKRKLGVAGDAFVDISVGKTGSPIGLADKAIIECRKDTDLMEIVQDLMAEVQQAALPAIDELQKTLMEYRLLAEDMRKPDGNIQQVLVQVSSIMANVDSLLAGLEKGEGSVGQILKDPAIANQVESILAKIDEATGQLNKALRETKVILDNVKVGSAVIPEAADTIRGELRDVPGVLQQTRATMHESEQLILGLQQHWLLSKSMPEENPLGAVSIDAVKSGSKKEESR